MHAFTHTYTESKHSRMRLAYMNYLSKRFLHNYNKHTCVSENMQTDIILYIYIYMYIYTILMGMNTIDIRRLQCNLDCPDPFGHRLIMEYWISEIVRKIEASTFLT